MADIWQTIFSNTAITNMVWTVQGTRTSDDIIPGWINVCASKPRNAMYVISARIYLHCVVFHMQIIILEENLDIMIEISVWRMS